jgi:hypothetical protein
MEARCVGLAFVGLVVAIPGDLELSGHIEAA